jgi:hypothetical protein
VSAERPNDEGWFTWFAVIVLLIAIVFGFSRPAADSDEQRARECIEANGRPYFNGEHFIVCDMP